MRYCWCFGQSSVLIMPVDYISTLRSHITGLFEASGEADALSIVCARVWKACMK